MANSRDLKMENVMLDDKQKAIKLVDFGLSNTFTADDLMLTHCGSPEYAAPELFEKDQKYGPEIDTWSLGIIMYAMLIGHLPFETPYTDQYRRQKLQTQIEKGLVHEHEREMANISAESQDLLHKLVEVQADLRLPLLDVEIHLGLAPQESQDLLHKLVEVQADLRLPLLDVEIHPWVSQHASLPFFPFQCIPRDRNMKHQAVDELSSLLDVNRKKLEPQLHEGKCDEMSAMFNMLLDRKRREDGIYDIDYTTVKVENKRTDKPKKPKKDVKKDGSAKNLSAINVRPSSPCLSERSHRSSIRDSVKSTSSRKSTSLRVPAVPISVEPPDGEEKPHESTTSATFDLLALCSTPSWLGPDRRKSRRKKKSTGPHIAKEGTTATLAGAVSGFGAGLAHGLVSTEGNSLQVPSGSNPPSVQSTPLHPTTHTTDTNHLPAPSAYTSTALGRSNSLKAPSRKVTVTVNRTALSRDNSLKVPGRQGAGRRRQSMFSFSPHRDRDSISKHTLTGDEGHDQNHHEHDTQLRIRIDYSPSVGKRDRKSSICIIENVISPPSSPVLNSCCNESSTDFVPPQTCSDYVPSQTTRIDTVIPHTVSVTDACDTRTQCNDSPCVSSSNCTPNVNDNRHHIDYNSLIEQRRNSPVPRPVRLGIKESYTQTASSNHNHGPKSTSQMNTIDCCNPCSNISSHDYYSVSNSSEALLKGHGKYSRVSATCAKLGINTSALCGRSNRRCVDGDTSLVDLPDDSAPSWRCSTKPTFFDATMLCSKMASLFPSYSASSPTINGDSDSDSSDSLLESMQINNLATLSDKETPDISGLNEDVFLSGFREGADANLGSLWFNVTPVVTTNPKPHSYSRTSANHNTSKTECLSHDMHENNNVIPTPNADVIVSEPQIIDNSHAVTVTTSPHLPCTKLSLSTNNNNKHHNASNVISNNKHSSSDNNNKTTNMQDSQTVCKTLYPDVPCKEREIPPLLPECEDIPRQSPVFGVPSSQISVLSSTIHPTQRMLLKTPLARTESFTSNDLDDFQVCDSLGSSLKNSLRSPFNYLNRKDKSKLPKGKRRFSLKALMEKSHSVDKEHRLETCVSESLLECSSEHNSDKNISDGSTDKLPSAPNKAKVHPKGDQTNRGSLTKINMDKSPSHNATHNSNETPHTTPQTSPATKSNKSNNKVKSINKTVPWKRNFANFLRKRKSPKNPTQKDTSTTTPNTQHSSSNSNGHARIPKRESTQTDDVIKGQSDTANPHNKQINIELQEKCHSDTPTNRSVKVFDFPNESPQKARFLTWGRCRECTRSHSSEEDESRLTKQVLKAYESPPLKLLKRIIKFQSLNEKSADNIALSSEVAVMEEDIKLRPMIGNCRTQDLPQTNACC